MSKIVIRNALVLSMDPAIGKLDKGDILIEGKKIVDVKPDLGAVADALVVDAAEMIAIPGFVDGHRHCWQSLLRASAVDWTLAQYFAGVRTVLGDRYTPEDMYIANLLAGLESIECGITTVFDFSHNNNSPAFADGAIRGLMDSGARAVFGYGDSNIGWNPVSSLPMDYNDVRRVRRQYFASDDQLVTMALASRGPQFSEYDLTVEELRLAREFGLYITMHVGDGLWGRSHPIQRLDAEKLLGADLTYVHCNHLLDEEYRIMADTGGVCVMSPEVELNMGHGNLAVLKLMQVGIRPALSIDINTSASGDMFSQMKTVLSGARSVVNARALIEEVVVDPLPIMASDVLEFATVQGAHACKLDGKIGSITPGKEADIVLIGTDTLGMTPMNNPVGIIVEGAHPGNVDSVFIAGKAVKRGGKLVGVDVQAVRRKIVATRDALYERTGVPSTGDWLPRPYQE